MKWTSAPRYSSGFPGGSSGRQCARMGGHAACRAEPRCPVLLPEPDASEAKRSQAAAVLATLARRDVPRTALSGGAFLWCGPAAVPDPPGPAAEAPSPTPYAARASPSAPCGVAPSVHACAEPARHRASSSRGTPGTAGADAEEAVRQPNKGFPCWSCR